MFFLYILCCMQFEEEDKMSCIGITAYVKRQKRALYIEKNSIREHALFKNRIIKKTDCCFQVSVYHIGKLINRVRKVKVVQRIHSLSDVSV